MKTKTAETIILRSTISYTLLQAAPWTALAFLLLVLAWTLSCSFMLFALPAMGFACYRLLYVSRYHYCIDREQIRCTYGFLWRKTICIDLRRCKYYTIDSSYLSRAIHCADLTLRTEAHEHVEIILKGLASESLLEKLRERILIARTSTQIYDASDAFACPKENQLPESSLNRASNP